MLIKPCEEIILRRSNTPGRDPIVTNVLGEAKRQLVQKERGDMSCKEYMQAIKEQTQNGK